MTDSQVQAILEAIKRVEEKIDALMENAKELPEQIEEYVIRVEDAALGRIDDFR